jgi:hypothetical protein
MPFVAGKFYANPGYGKGVEEARAASSAGADGGSSADEDFIGEPTRNGGKGAVHRIVIEATEVVPAHTGRAQSGFVAHVHRTDGGPRGLGMPSKGEARAETHVFTDHRDVADFVGGAVSGE